MPTNLGASGGPKYSCLENSMDRGAWQATVHGIRVRHDWGTSTYLLRGLKDPHIDRKQCSIVQWYNFHSLCVFLARPLIQWHLWCIKTNKLRKYSTINKTIIESTAPTSPLVIWNSTKSVFFITLKLLALYIFSTMHMYLPHHHPPYPHQIFTYNDTFIFEATVQVF